MEYGLIGGRLSYSLSPEIHKILGYDYEILEIKEEEIEVFLNERDFKGINITNPYKNSVIPYLDSLTETAMDIGAVNTIINREGKLIGDNTDYKGFKALLKKFDINPDKEMFLIFGNGATVGTVRKVIEKAGGNVKIIARSGEHNFSDFSYMKDAGILVNALPVGVYPLSIKGLENIHTVIDLNYSPYPTRILREANFLKKRAISGLYMLIAQAFYSSEEFRDRNSDFKLIDEIYEKLRKKLISKKVIVINGANINMLGIREPEIYGYKTYKDLVKYIEDIAKDEEMEVEIYQSNHEGDIIDKIQDCYEKKDAIIINAGAFTHTSIGIYDSLKAVGIPAVEVHLSDTSKREDFRQVSFLRNACEETFKGKGFESYREAIIYFSGRECL